METQKSSQQSSLAVRSKLKTAWRRKFSRQKHPAPGAHPQDQEASQEKQQEYEVVATQFHLFSDLPVELRLKIWAEATRYKRFVILNPPFNSPVACFRLLRRLDRDRAPGYVGERRPAWTSRTPPPPLLSVSKEAREVALKTWQLAFSINDVPPGVLRRLSFQAFFLVCRATAGTRTAFRLLTESVVPNDRGLMVTDAVCIAVHKFRPGRRGDRSRRTREQGWQGLVH